MSATNHNDRRAPVYGRVSSPGQSSIPSQIDWARHYAEANALSILWDGRQGQAFVDHGLSGDDTSRPGLVRLEAFFRKHHEAGDPITRLLVWHIDRISRADTIDTFAVYSALRKCGLRYVHTSDRVIDLHNVLDRTLLSIEQDHKANPFLKDTAARVLDGMAKTVRAGFWIGKIPFGYRLVRTPGEHGAGSRRRSGKLAADPVAAPLVVELFRRYVGNEGSTTDLANWMNTQIRPPRAKAWCSQLVNYILSNNVYTGTVVFGARPQGKRARLADGGNTVKTDGEGGGIEGAVINRCGCPALIDEATYQAAQERLATGKRRGEVAKRPPLPLAGLGKCGHCGNSLHACNARKKRKAGVLPLAILACGSRLRFQGVCTEGSSATPHDAVLAKVLSLIGEHVLAGDFPERVTRDVEGKHADRQRREAAERDNLTRRIADLEGTLHRSAYRLTTVADDMVAAVQEGIRQVREELATLQNRLGELDAECPVDDTPIDPAKVRAFFDACRQAVSVKVESREAGALLNRLLHAITDGFTLYFKKNSQGRVTPDYVEVALPAWVTRSLAGNVYLNGKWSDGPAVVLTARF